MALKPWLALVLNARRERPWRSASNTHWSTLHAAKAARPKAVRSSHNRPKGCCDSQPRAPLGLVAFVALLFMRETPLGSKSGIDIAREQAA